MKQSDQPDKALRYLYIKRAAVGLCKISRKIFAVYGVCYIILADYPAHKFTLPVPEHFALPSCCPFVVIRTEKEEARTYKATADYTICAPEGYAVYSDRECTREIESVSAAEISGTIYIAPKQEQ